MAKFLSKPLCRTASKPARNTPHGRQSHPPHHGCCGTGLPYGSYPRLILIWMTRGRPYRKSRVGAGSSLRVYGTTGLKRQAALGTIPRFRDQIERLIGAAISTRWSSDANGQNQTGGEFLWRTGFILWTPQELPYGSWQSPRDLSMNFFEQLVAAPVPLDLRAVRALKRRRWRSISTPGRRGGSATCRGPR